MCIHVCVCIQTYELICVWAACSGYRIYFLWTILPMLETNWQIAIGMHFTWSTIVACNSIGSSSSSIECWWLSIHLVPSLSLSSSLSLSPSPLLYMGRIAKTVSVERVELEACLASITIIYARLCNIFGTCTKYVISK